MLPDIYLNKATPEGFNVFRLTVPFWSQGLVNATSGAATYSVAELSNALMPEDDRYRPANDGQIRFDGLPGRSS
jgi:hypothetical protein